MNDEDHIESSDCPCNPRCFPFEFPDGTTKWMISHNYDSKPKIHAQNVAREPL